MFNAVVMSVSSNYTLDTAHQVQLEEAVKEVFEVVC